MKRQRSTRYSRRTVIGGRRLRRPQARKRRTFKLTVPVTWRSADGAPSAKSRGAKEKRPRRHAISWRVRVEALLSALFGSPRWVSFLLLAGVGCAFYFVGADSTYYISAVEVDGAATLSQEYVVDASGMDGMHIFWLDPAGVAQRVADIPSVLTATVQIEWPNRARITVVERTPVMVWDQAGDRFWVNADGRLMQARQESAGLLMVLSQEQETLYVGERIPPEVLTGALQLRQERPNIELLYYSRANGLCYLDGRNWEVFFGVGRDMNQKLAVYEALVADLLARGSQPRYISVINKDKPFYRLVEPVD